MKPLLVFEDTTRPRWRLWTALGVEWWATRWVWLSPLFWMALGCAVAWSDPAAAGSLAGSRMDAVVLTSTRDVNVYRGPKRKVAERIRVVRSLGGPLANAALGAVCLGAAFGLADPSVTGPAPVGWLRMFGVFNVCIAIWTLAPVPTMDGWIVWRWIFRRGGPHA